MHTLQTHALRFTIGSPPSGSSTVTVYSSAGSVPHTSQIAISFPLLRGVVLGLHAGVVGIHRLLLRRPLELLLQLLHEPIGQAFQDVHHEGLSLALPVRPLVLKDHRLELAPAWISWVPAMGLDGEIHTPSHLNLNLNCRPKLHCHHSTLLIAAISLSPRTCHRQPSLRLPRRTPLSTAPLIRLEIAQTTARKARNPGSPRATASPSNPNTMSIMAASCGARTTPRHTRPAPPRQPMLSIADQASQ